MQITLDIPNQEVAKNLLWMLEHFEKDGVKITNITNITNKTLSSKTADNLTDAQIKQNWKTLLLNSNSEVDYFKSESFKMDKAQYLTEKYK